VARMTILGSSGTGKSWYAGWMIENIAPELEYGIHLDYEDEERGLSLAENPLYETAAIDEDLLSTDFESVLRRDKRLRVVPDGLKKSEIQDLAESLADAALEVGDCFFSWDEAHNVAGKHEIGDRLERLVTGGRKFGVEWLAVTQRPQKLHEDILSQSNVSVYFAVDSDRDLKKVDESSSVDIDRIRELDERQAIIENHGTGDVKAIDTNNLDRKYPHVAGDDGKAEDVLF
jgi:DNA helicase HerA-like ATPase